MFAVCALSGMWGHQKPDGTVMVVGIGRGYEDMLIYVLKYINDISITNMTILGERYFCHPISAIRAETCQPCWIELFHHSVILET